MMSPVAQAQPQTLYDEDIEKISQMQADTDQIRKLRQEYDECLSFGRDMAGEIYLVDILEKLYFLDNTVTVEK